MSKYTDDWLSVINGVLDKISDFAGDAVDILTGDDRRGRPYKNAPNTNDAQNTTQNKPVYVDQKKLALSVANQKVKWWVYVLKYVASASLLPFSAGILAAGLDNSGFGATFLATLALIGFGCSLGLFISGNCDRRLRSLITRYLPVIGHRPEASVAYLSHVLDEPAKKVKKEVKLLLAENVFSTEAYFDKKMDILVLDGYREEPSIVDIPEPEPAKEESADDMKDMPCNLGEWVRQLVYLNRSIQDEIVSMKLDIITDHVKKIADYASSHPECQKKLRTLVNYYLPTTVKLMDAYKTIEIMGDVGDNVKETKLRIENSLDSLVLAYKKQLDGIYSAEAFDISGDIDVLETMMKRDGFDTDGQIK